MRRPSAPTVYYALEFLLSMPTWVVVALYLVQDINGRAIRHGGREPELDELPAGAAP